MRCSNSIRGNLFHILLSFNPFLACIFLVIHVNRKLRVKCLPQTNNGNGETINLAIDVDGRRPSVSCSGMSAVVHLAQYFIVETKSPLVQLSCFFFPADMLIQRSRRQPQMCCMWTAYGIKYTCVQYRNYDVTCGRRQPTADNAVTQSARRSKWWAQQVRGSFFSARIYY